MTLPNTNLNYQRPLHCSTWAPLTIVVVHTVIILVRVHSGITSACEHRVVILVHVHSDITSMCVHSGNTSVCTQWYY